ncbi:MAG TPA: hypothetical protein VI168_00470 [Croceibacterium sp.]
MRARATSCLFAGGGALLRAALEAERLLARPPIVKVAPLRALSRLVAD